MSASASASARVGTAVSGSASASATASSEAGQSGNPCGLSPNDWCAAPAGDACGQHKDAASCRADVRCAGMPYQGESVVACQWDERGFADNCPAVGCVSLGGEARAIHTLAGALAGNYVIEGFPSDQFRCPECAKKGRCACAGDYLVLSEQKRKPHKPLDDHDLVVFTPTPGALDLGKRQRVWVRLTDTSFAKRPLNDAKLRSFEPAAERAP